MSTLAKVHGYMALVMGAFFLLAPAQAIAFLSVIAAAVGVAMPSFTPIDLAMSGALTMAYGTAHVHTGTTAVGKYGNANMVCSESVLALAAAFVAWKHGPFFLIFAATPAIFALLCALSMYSHPAEKSAKKAH